MLVAFLIKSNSSSRVLSIGVPLSGRKAEERIELISTHIITELSGVDVVIPASTGSGNRLIIDLNGITQNLFGVGGGTE